MKATLKAILKTAFKVTVFAAAALAVLALNLLTYYCLDRALQLEVVRTAICGVTATGVSMYVGFKMLDASEEFDYQKARAEAGRKGGADGEA